MKSAEERWNAFDRKTKLWWYIKYHLTQPLEYPFFGFTFVLPPLWIILMVCLPSIIILILLNWIGV